MLTEKLNLAGRLSPGIFAAIVALPLVLIVLAVSILFQIGELSRTVHALSESTSSVALSQSHLESDSVKPEDVCSSAKQADQVDLRALAQAITEKGSLLERLAHQLARCGYCQVSPESQVNGAMQRSFDGAAARREADVQLAPLTRHLGNPLSALKWRESASAEDVEYVDSVLKRYAEQARQRIAAETDPKRPDARVIREIMEQTRESISSELSSVWDTSEPQISR